MGVIRRVPSGTRAAGAGPGKESFTSGHSGQSVPKIKRHIHQEWPRPGAWPGMDDEVCGVSGLKYRVPSKWSESRCCALSVSAPGSLLPVGSDREHASARKRINIPNPNFTMVFISISDYPLRVVL